MLKVNIDMKILIERINVCVFFTWLTVYIYENVVDENNQLINQLVTP